MCVCVCVCVCVCYSLLLLCVAVIAGSQECMNNVGSLQHDDVRVIADQTFILADHEYAVTCEGMVIAWEFCYRVQNRTSVTFYPGIWLANESVNSTMNYTLVRSNQITFDSVQVDDGINDVICRKFTLSEADQFIAPAGSVVGVYSNLRFVRPELLRTNKAMSRITTYSTPGNHSSIQTINPETRDIGYNIGIRVHLGRCKNLY